MELKTEDFIFEKISEEFEKDGINKMKMNLQKSCYEKCITKPSTFQFDYAENPCLDRCVLKYLETQVLVANQLKNLYGKK